MSDAFGCCFVNELGNTLKIWISETCPAWMDLLNTLCGAHPVEWIGDNSHNKIICCTHGLKERMTAICRRHAGAVENLNCIANFFNEQPDDTYIAFLREGTLPLVDDKLIAHARSIALRHNYVFCKGLESQAGTKEVETCEGRPFTICMFTSERTASLKPLGKKFPKALREVIISLLNPICDFGIKAVRDCNCFRKLEDLRKLADSKEVRTSEVGSLINGEICKLAELDGETVVVFGILENADINQLTNLKEACVYARNHKSHRGFYDILMATDRDLYLDGYRRRRFTDLGFEYRIKGNKTVCRFCERSRTDGKTFKNAPHAISYFFGNHHLLGGSECDTCNEYFGHELEPHFYRYYQPTMISAQKTGRGKKPQMEGENFAAEIGRFKLKLNAEDVNIVERLKKGEEVQVELNDSQPVVKADIYRCLCKYVVSLIDDSELSLFEGTVKWIRKKHLSGRLPLIYRNEKDFECIDSPVIEIYSPLNQLDGDKGWIVVFRFLSNLWVFAIPYTNIVRNYKLSRILKNFINKYLSGINFVSENFDDEGDSYITTHFSYKMGPESRFVPMTEMTPDEQQAFKDSMPKKWRK